MNRLLRVFAVFLACILFLMGAVIAEEEDETDFDSLPLSVQELLKDRTYYESALSFVFCERRDERERRIEVEQKQGIAPTSAENWKWGFYDKKSGYIQQPRYDEIYDLDCDDADAPILVGIGENYGYLVRSSGAIAIPFVYGYCGENSEFVNDYAVVEKREATGECHDVLITTSGEEIAFPEGYELTSFVYQDKIVVSYCFECEDEYSGIYYDFLYGLGTTNGEIYLRIPLIIAPKPSTSSPRPKFREKAQFKRTICTRNKPRYATFIRLRARYKFASANSVQQC